ncbi:MAG TPA: hypothetical protein VFV10_08490 [Gammaproteobacteria bacterium]|nr:hypothetical protein [Gammaproteobacteria bacterium]
MTPHRIVPVALAALLACSAARAEIKAYDVDARYRQEVYRALRDVLQTDHAPFIGAVGEVSLLPTGQILVDGPDDVQAQVAAVLDAIAKKAAAETPPPSHSALLRYWVLFGVPGQQTADAVPTVLDGVVRELEGAHGEMAFTVLDTASLSSESGETGQLHTKTLKVTQRIFTSKETLNASITIDHQDEGLSVNISLHPGEFAVLSEGSVENDQGRKGLLAFVVNWPASR